MLEIDGTLIVMALSFIIFVFIMQKIFYTPMTQVREERKNYIANNVELANAAKDDAYKITKDYENKIISARKEATNVVSEHTASASKEKAKTLEAKTKELNEHINLAKENIAKDKNNAKEALKSQVMSLAHSISIKILGEEIPLSGVASEIIDKELNR